MTSTDNPFDDYSHLLQVVDFAIREEQEAFDFYQALALRATTASTQAELHRMAAMEQDHRNRLEILNVAEAASTMVATSMQLNISDYGVTHRPDQEMAREGIIRLAIDKEVAAFALYSDMANLLPNSPMKQLFLSLAAEEALHKRYLETLPAEEI